MLLDAAVVLAASCVRISISSEKTLCVSMMYCCYYGMLVQLVVKMIYRSVDIMCCILHVDRIEPNDTVLIECFAINSLRQACVLLQRKLLQTRKQMRTINTSTSMTNTNNSTCMLCMYVSVMFIHLQWLASCMYVPQHAVAL
jgi:hypothetical protein